MKNDTKTGRNDKCPCGSGLKYKKCCLVRLDEFKKIEWETWFDNDLKQGEANLKAANEKLVESGVLTAEEKG